MDIEEVAAHTPEKIHKVFIDPVAGLTDAQADEIARRIGIPEALDGAGASTCFKELYKLLHGDRRVAGRDQSADPRPATASVIALDAKLNFDANALFRHPEIVALRDLDEEDPAEIEAIEVRPRLHLARRQHRLPGERRRPRDGDDGHHQAVRRRAGQLPRRRRRRHGREGDRGVQDHAAATRR